MLLKRFRKLDLPYSGHLRKIDLYHLVAAYLLICLPMMGFFPLFLSAFAVFVVLLKLAAVRYQFVVPYWFAIILMLLSFFVVFKHADQFGQEYVAIACLFCFASLKLLEAKADRDAFILMLINMLLIMGSLMATQSPLVFAYLLLCFLYNVYINIRISQPADLKISIKENLRALMRIFLMSLPFVLILFFFFPRLEPLWERPGPPQSKTGLSDEMTPNSLTALTQDGGMAFRVAFENNEIPKKQYLYWRGPVLADFDGKTWRRNSQDFRDPTNVYFDKTSKINYTMFHSGETDTWVVPLDLPEFAPKGARMSNAFELRARKLQGKANAIEVSSYLRYRVGKLSNREVHENTFLPKGIFPKTRALALQLRQESKNDEAFAYHVWQYFRKEPFSYDLEPPVGNADIDQFMFGNRIGYCEHFASAFAFMMRSAGVPARVVTGYQGGEQNPISGELEVRQLNAHAWNEVYFADKGWVRFDPTAAVAPERINRGSPFGSAKNTESIALSARLENDSEWIKTMNHSLRALSAFWGKWVLNYNKDKQDNLWESLGMGDMKNYIWLIFCFVAALLLSGFLYWQWLRHRYRHEDAIAKTMRPFFTYVAKNAMPVLPHMALYDWLLQYQPVLQASALNAKQVIDLYYALRYQPQVETEPLLRSLRQAIAAFIEKDKKQKPNV